MKKNLTLILAVLFSISLNAQTNLTEAVDFTATDHEGNEINLFEILDGGQYVLIDFFFSSCTNCPQVTTNMVDAYYSLGCNEGDVFFLEISSSDHTTSAQKWIDTYNVPYPTIHNINPAGPSGIAGQGYDICVAYGIENEGSGYPTTILIAPDHSIVYNDIYPISSPEDIINPLVEAGITEQPCDGQEAEVLVEIVKERSTKLDVKFAPNAATASYYYMISESTTLTAEEVQAQGTKQTGEYTEVFTELKPNTIYNIYVVAVDNNENADTFKTTQAVTLCDGGEGMSVITVTVSLTEDGTKVRAIAEPNEETSEYHYAWRPVTSYEEEVEKTIDGIKHDGYPLCDVDIWEVPVENIEAIPGDWYVVAIGMNGEAEWGDVCLTRFNLATIDVTEMAMNNVSIYPNPATSNIYVKSAMNGEGQISIIDVTGRIVKDINVADMSNATINVEDVENGIYFVKIQQNGNSKIEKVVIK